jgi:hypothetical protein
MYQCAAQTAENKLTVNRELKRIKKRRLWLFYKQFTAATTKSRKKMSSEHQCTKKPSKINHGRKVSKKVKERE